MFSTLKSYALIVASILLIAVSGFAYYSDTRLKATTSKLETASANAKAYEEYAAKAEVVHKKETIRNEQVQAAVEANPEWADLPLPDDVASLLRHPTGATQAVP